MSVQITFDARAKADLMKGVKSYMKRFNWSRNQALDAVAFDIRSNAIRTLDGNGTTDRGLLKNSITIEKTFSGGRRIGTNTGYGLYVEFGRPPGKAPNSKHLEGWVKRKLGISGKRAKYVAFLIGRGIAERGTKAQPFLRPAFESQKKKLILEMKKHMK